MLLLYYKALHKLIGQIEGRYTYMPTPKSMNEGQINKVKYTYMPTPKSMNEGQINKVKYTYMPTQNQ